MKSPKIIHFLVWSTFVHSNVCRFCLYLHNYRRICIWKTNKQHKDYRDYDKYSWTSCTTQNPIEIHKKCKSVVVFNFQFKTNESRVLHIYNSLILNVKTIHGSHSYILVLITYNISRVHYSKQHILSTTR